MADPRAGRPLNVTPGFPGSQDSMEIIREEEEPWSIGLCILGSEKELPFGQVNLPLLEGADLPHPHTAVIGEADGDLCVIRQRPSEREKVFMLKEARPDVVFLQHGNMRDASNKLRGLLKPQAEHALEASKFAIYCVAGSTIFLSLDDVCFDLFARDPDSAHRPEERLEMEHVFPKPPGRLPPIHFIVILLP